MTGTALLAYAHARARARKSRIVSPAVLAALAVADHPELTVSGWRDVRSDSDAAALLSLAFERLVDDYAAMIRACPPAAPVLWALLRLHEAENVKLGWRAAVNRIEPARWRDAWRPLGPLESVRRSDCAEATSPGELARALADTPFGAIAARMLRAHASDLAAAEMTLDRFASDALAVAIAALPTCERLSRELAATVVCERDVGVVERAISVLGVAQSAAMQMTSMLARVMGPSAGRLVADWPNRPREPLAIPRSLRGGREPVRTLEDLRRSIHAARRAASRRAFAGSPYCLAPPIALVLMREDEARALVSTGELRARNASACEAAAALALDG